MPEINLNDCEVRTTEVHGVLLKLFSCPTKSGFSFEYEGQKYGQQFPVGEGEKQPDNIVLDRRETDARLYLDKLERGESPQTLSPAIGAELDKVGINPAPEEPTEVPVVTDIRDVEPDPTSIWNRGKRVTKEDIQAAAADPLENK